MKFTTKTEYGLVCLVYMAKQGKDKLVTVHDLVTHENMPEPYLQKIFHTLNEAGILASHPGRNGGYTLSRPATEITLKEIVDALEGQTFEVFCEPEKRKDIVCTHFSLCSISPVWAKTKELLDQFFGTVTLDRIAKEPKEIMSLNVGGNHG